MGVLPEAQKEKTFVYHGADIRELAGINLSGAHIHLYGAVGLENLSQLNLHNTTIIINTSKPSYLPNSGVLQAVHKHLHTRLLGSSSKTSGHLQKKRKLDSNPPSVFGDGEVVGKKYENEQHNTSLLKPFPQPAASMELHPSRMNMLQDTTAEAEAAPQPIYRTVTGENRSAMPFNRLAGRQSSSKIGFQGQSNARDSAMALDSKPSPPKDEVDNFLAGMDHVINASPVPFTDAAGLAPQAMSDQSTDVPESTVHIKEEPLEPAGVLQTIPSAPMHVDEPVASVTFQSQARATPLSAAAKDAGTRLVVENLDLSASEDDVRALFALYNVQKVFTVNSYLLMRPTGYAFVDMETRAEAIKLMLDAQTRKFVLYNREVVIKQAEAAACQTFGQV